MQTGEEGRRRMVEEQIKRRGVSDPRVLAAVARVPRDLFVPEVARSRAHDDAPLAIGAGQTISQPFVVALMVEAAEIKPQDRVLEVGAGSGYAAAVMAELAARVLTIERHADLAGQAEERLRKLGYDDVQVRVGDGARGWPEAAPFDAILVAAASPAIPVSLQEQLDIGGRLIIPVGAREAQRLLRIRRVAANRYEEEDLGGVLFVPLISEEAWRDGGDSPA